MNHRRTRPLMKTLCTSLVLGLLSGQAWSQLAGPAEFEAFSQGTWTQSFQGISEQGTIREGLFSREATVLPPRRCYWRHALSWPAWMTASADRRVSQLTTRNGAPG